MGIKSMDIIIIIIMKAVLCGLSQDTINEIIKQHGVENERRNNERL
jgi:hypothetical protein